MPVVLFVHTYSSRKQIMWTVTMVLCTYSVAFSVDPRWAHSNSIPPYPCKLLILHFHLDPSTFVRIDIRSTICSISLGQSENLSKLQDDYSPALAGSISSDSSFNSLLADQCLEISGSLWIHSNIWKCSDDFSVGLSPWMRLGSYCVCSSILGYSLLAPWYVDTSHHTLEGYLF